MTKKLSEEQKIFNIIVRHLGKQRKRSFDKSKAMCMYRGPNNTKCAVGCLIPNKDYSCAFEGSDIDMINQKLNFIWNDKQVNLLADLQIIHDESAVRAWPTELRNLGHTNNLDVSVVKEAFGR
jgi:hypothetical protein